jgi:signal transduction histidine kinase
MLAGGREHSVIHALDLKSALALAVELERAQMGLLMLHDQLSGRLFPAIADGMTPTQCSEFGLHRPGTGPFGIAFSEQRAVSIQCDGDLGDPLQASIQRLGCARMLAVPLSTDAKTVLGMLVLLYRKGVAAPAGPLLLHYASVLATAVENVLLRDAAEHALERAQVRSRARMQYFARISHELRTPLQSVLGYLDLMRVEDALPDRQLQLLARATMSGEVMLSVIDDLINYSRLEVGRVTYRLRRVSISDAMAATEIVVAPLAASRGIQLHVEPSPKVFAHADSSKLRQILVNLVANAVRFTPPGGSVKLAAHKADGRSSPWVSVRVTDTGPGIPSDKLHQIFEPFSQLGIPTLEGLGGSGLGLPISREFATAMGGDLEATSDGHGSTFTLRLLRDRLSRRPRSSANGTGDHIASQGPARIPTVRQGT